MSFYSLVLHPSPSCSGHSFPAGGAKQYIGVYVPGESQSPFARRGSDSVFWVPLYKYEKLQQQGSTCVSGTDSVAFLMSRTRTDRQTFTRSIFSRRSTKSAIVRFKQHGGWMVVVTSVLMALGDGLNRTASPIFRYLYLNSVNEFPSTFLLKKIGHNFCALDVTSTL